MQKAVNKKSANARFETRISVTVDFFCILHIPMITVIFPIIPITARTFVGRKCLFINKYQVQIKFRLV